jgi:hypothetical protein
MNEVTTDRGMNAPDVRSFGRMTRSVLGYALATAFMFISPLVLFVPAALMNCVLRNGRKATVIALLLASGLLVIASLGTDATHAPRLGSGEISNVLSLLLAIGLPSLLAFLLVRRGTPFGQVVLAGTGASAAGLVFIELLMRAASGYSPYDALIVNFHENSLALIKFYREQKVPEDAITAMKAFSDRMAAGYTPAMLMIPAILMFVLSLVMLSRLPAWRQYVLSRQDPESAPLRSGPYLFRNLKMPDWVLVAFLIGGVAPLLTGMAQKVSGNILAVVGFLYLLQGLAVFRSLLITIGAGFAVVMIAYTALALFTASGIAPLLLAIAGLFDSFFDFRHFKRKDDSNESHID